MVAVGPTGWPSPLPAAAPALLLTPSHSAGHWRRARLRPPIAIATPVELELRPSTAAAATAAAVSPATSTAIDVADARANPRWLSDEAGVLVHVVTSIHGNDGCAECPDADPISAWRSRIWGGGCVLREWRRRATRTSRSLHRCRRCRAMAAHSHVHSFIHPSVNVSRARARKANFYQTVTLVQLELRT